MISVTHAKMLLLKNATSWMGLWPYMRSFMIQG
uniref:Uncharacterized protein n=1 Tax=Arundo donax TaxID=35708 RepID=A0A0A9A7N2_ARUDO